MRKEKFEVETVDRAGELLKKNKKNCSKKLEVETVDRAGELIVPN